MPMLTWTLPLVALLVAPPIGRPTPPVAQPIDGDTFHPTPGVTQPEVGVRLRMSLKMRRTTDAFEAGQVGLPSISDFTGTGNSEDEIYYTLAMVPPGGGNGEIKTIRPSGSPDIWEMGPKSLVKQQRVLYEGEHTASEQAFFALAIGEQDNAQIAMLSALFGDMATLIETALGMHTNNNEVPAAFGPAARNAVERINDNGDDLIGAMLITVGGGRKLRVDATGNMFVKITESSNTEVSAELTGSGALYNIRLWVEDTAVPRPATRKVVGKTSDKCGEQDLWVVGKDGQVLMRKGDVKEIPLGAGEFKWFCDGDEERAVANAGTEVLSARRASSGRNINWIFLREDTATPDFVD